MSLVDWRRALTSISCKASLVSHLIRRAWACAVVRVLIGSWVFYFYFRFIEDCRRGSDRTDLLAALGEWSVLMAIFPFLFWVRHQFTKRDGRKEKLQIRSVVILLWISLVMAIFFSWVVASYEMKVAVTKESLSFSNQLVLEVVTGFGVLSGVIIGGMAGLVQLWRDLWSPWLTGACLLVYGILFLHWILPHEFRF